MGGPDRYCLTVAGFHTPRRVLVLLAASVLAAACSSGHRAPAAEETSIQSEIACSAISQTLQTAQQQFRADAQSPSRLHQTIVAVGANLKAEAQTAAEPVQAFARAWSQWSLLLFSAYERQPPNQSVSARVSDQATAISAQFNRACRQKLPGATPP